MAIAVRTSQLGVEVVEIDGAVTRVSQAIVEPLMAGHAVTRITQTIVEIIFGGFVPPPPPPPTLPNGCVAELPADAGGGQACVASSAFSSL